MTAAPATAPVAATARRVKRRLRERSEHFLRLHALDELRRGQPGTTPAAPDDGARFWRYVFVPVYARIPWPVKQRAMSALGMTATGWTAPDRRARAPWRPPPPKP